VNHPSSSDPRPDHFSPLYGSTLFAVLGNGWLWMSTITAVARPVEDQSWRQNRLQEGVHLDLTAGLPASARHCRAFGSSGRLTRLTALPFLRQMRFSRICSVTRTTLEGLQDDGTHANWVGSIVDHARHAYRVRAVHLAIHFITA